MNVNSKESQNNQKNQVVKNAVAMSLGTFSSRLLGLLRDTLMMSMFPRYVTDAWSTAFRLPNILRRLLGEGSLSVSLIPVFVDCLQSPDHTKKAQNFLNSLYTLLLVILTLITVLGIVFSDKMLLIILDDVYVQNAENFGITVKMSQIMFGFIFLMSQYALFMGILNSLGQFSWPALAPLFFNIAMITFTLLPDHWFGFPGEGLAWGVLIGGFLQMAVLVPLLVKKGFMPRLSFDLWTPEVKRVLSRMVPGLFGLGVLQISLIINNRFASSLGEGPISYIYIADRLLELPLSLVSVSLGTALLPMLSELFVQGKKEAMLETTEYYFRLNLYVVMACATGLYFLAEPIVELFFRRGKFTSEDLHLTTQVIQIWAIIMIPASGVRILAPAYYAIQNTWLPSVVSLFSLVGHYLLAPVLMARWGLTGLNVSSLASSSFNFLVLFFLFPFLIGRLPGKKILVSTVKFILICILMGLSLQIHPFLKEMFIDKWHFLMKVAVLFFSIALASLVFVVVSIQLKMDEYQGTFAKVFKRVLSRIKR